MPMYLSKCEPRRSKKIPLLFFLIYIEGNAGEKHHTVRGIDHTFHKTVDRKRRASVTHYIEVQK
jgi:hypothetical protein